MPNRLGALTVHQDSTCLRPSASLWVASVAFGPLFWTLKCLSRIKSGAAGLSRCESIWPLSPFRSWLCAFWAWASTGGLWTPRVSPRRLFFCESNIDNHPLPIGLDLFKPSFLSQAFQSDTRNNLFRTFSCHRGAVSLSGHIQPLTTISFILSAADQGLWPVTKVQLKSPPGFRGPALKPFSSPQSTGHPTHQMLSFTLNHKHRAPG